MSSGVNQEIYHHWKQILHQQGYRVTRPRQLVMEIILSSQTALTPQEIYEISLEAEQSLGIASVYRTIEMLEELALIQQVHKPGGCHAIWPALEGHNHYLVCEDCGRIEVIPGNEAIGDYINTVETHTGYQIEGHWLQLFGSCQKCLQQG